MRHTHPRKAVRHPLAADLSEMLSYCRPHTDQTTETFCDRYLSVLPGAYVDQWGNWHVTVGDGPPRVLWSCHTDTVHQTGGRQRVRISDGLVTLPDGSTRNCLGADDTAGVWLALELIRRQIAGRYVFHFGEERGGIGSGMLAHRHPDWLAECQMAIALDRAGYDEVITHQGGNRTASDTFAREFGARIGLGYTACPHGVYTDTAEYADLIPECTNLSVGYEHAHSRSERLDLDHLMELVDRLSEVDYDALPVDRTPGDDGRHDPDDRRMWWRSTGHSAWTTTGKLWNDVDDLDDLSTDPDADRVLGASLDALDDDWRVRNDDRANGTYLNEDYQALVREYFRDRLLGGGR